MNLLMIIIIVLAIWVAGAVFYFAWQLVPRDPDGKAGESSRPDSAERPTDRDD